MNRETEDLFHELAALSRTQQEAYFAACQVPGETRAEVEALLRADQLPDDELDASVAAAAQLLLDEARPIGPGDRCGAYLLTRLLGQGGAGCVYLAERADGEVEQVVAIKLLYQASFRPFLRERFLLERQILASLNHPGIARLLDAGHAADGRPYLVMERVDGTAIDAYADRLDLREKIRLFLQLCDAVSYAHRNLVIHRDIKPSNVLVDASGRVKLLDFGIARMLDVAADPAVTSERLLTPEYASPEQARGTARSVASDIYSLGALLYKLLAGRPPHEISSDSQEAIELAICRHDPPPPSRAWSSIPSDLDYIVAKTLRKDPEDRYRSVDALAADLHAFLERRPIQARRGDRWYRARRFLRRNWIPAVAGTFVLASLSTALYLTARERAVAQRRFAEVRRLAHTLVFDLHDEIARVEGATKARELTVRTALEYLDHLSKDAGDDIGLEREIASAYVKIGDAQGYPTQPNLGRIADAESSYRKAAAIYRRMAARDKAAVPELARFYTKYAGLVRFIDHRQARELAEFAVRTFEPVYADGHLDLEGEYMGAWCTLGDMEEDLGDVNRAWDAYRRCRDLGRARLAAKDDRRGISMLAQANERIATAARDLGRFPEALAALDEDEAAVRKLLAVAPRNPGLHRREAIIHLYRSTVYFDDQHPNLGDPARALDSAKRYLASAEAMVRSDPSNASAQLSRAIARYWLSVPLRETDPVAAVATAQEAVRLFDEMIASGDSGYLVTSRRVRALEQLGRAQLRAGRSRDAWRSASAALEAQRRLVDTKDAQSQKDSALLPILVLAGEAAAAVGDRDRAQRFLEEAGATALNSSGNDLPALILRARAEQALGTFYLRRGRLEDARQSYRRLVDLWQRTSHSGPYVDRQRAASARLFASLDNDE